tara:strand:- start:781 stop:1251 length:471 start_codon:yes stop_codon:yes gene_type:complete
VSKFEDNGGYYIDGVPYMDCKYTGEPVRNVSTDVKYVIGPKALQAKMYKKFPESMDVAFKPSYKPTGRPAGWHWMAEFVDKDGNVFHKGVEQPKLKGTLPPTKVKKPKKKAKRRTRDEILVAKHKEKMAAQRKQKRELAKELKKQQDFLNHKTGDK